MKAVKRAPVDAEQGRLPIGDVEPVKINQKTHHAIVEAMPDRLEPRMHDVANVERSPIAFDGWQARSGVRLLHGSLRGFSEFSRCLAPRHRGAQRVRYRQSRPQPVFVESITSPGATEPGVALALNIRQPLLGSKGSRVELRMFADVLTEGQRRVGF